MNETVVAEYGIESIKSQLRTTWMAGDYDRFSRYMEPEARAFFERLPLSPNLRLLDVACGSGQLALIAARAGINASGIDIAENLIVRARARAAAADGEGRPHLVSRRRPHNRAGSAYRELHRVVLRRGVAHDDVSASSRPRPSR